MRRFRPAASAFANDAPISGINTTPLIDVMLVLLIMFVITIPPMMNQVPMELPQPAPDRGRPVTVHRLELLRDGTTLLDGAAVDAKALASRLTAVRADPQASLVIRSDADSRYGPFVEVLAVVKRAGITRLGFEGNAAFREL